MIFRSRLFSATWDTWMYYNDGIYYLYYLITEKSPGEGFGVATSTDGIHYTDHGMQLAASDQMVFYLGTGSVWKKRPFDGEYLCNYSEWRMHGDKRIQQIFFASSKDLIHWNKFDESHTLQLDTRYYQDDEALAARWDCINPMPAPDGYYGYWTARPLERTGIGFGKSEDGLSWQVLEPPQMDNRVFHGMELESGSTFQINGRYFMLIGSYGHEAGIVIMHGASPTGPFEPQPKSFALFANQTRETAYFARAFDTPDGILINYHVLLRQINEYDRPLTSLAPLKLAHVDEEGILRLKWWRGNQQLIGREIEKPAQRCVLDADITNESTFELLLTDGTYTRICVNTQSGYASVWEADEKTAEIDRQLPLCSSGHVRLVIVDTMIELYLNEWYLLNYTLAAPLHDVECKNQMHYFEAEIS